MKRSTITLALAAVLAAAAPTAVLAQASAASAAAPAQGSASAVVLSQSTRVLTTLEQRRAEFKANPAALKAFIKTEFNTAFDGNYAARLVLGVHGRGASDAEVSGFADALADNLTARYGQSLLDFNSRLRVRIKSETPLPNGKGVRVSSEMLRESGDPVPVDYLMRNVGGQWKIFDVMIEGISYVQTFKNQFDGPLRQKSIAQVTADLRAGRMQASGDTGQR
ncbi:MULTISPECIES: MlaC/ttg2D family ABC transporter substrate-binding protein [Pseudoxanthomonas]|uniref:ABC transporter substrate-binding protein n=1 Tax=Pseudoxanthomonas winnipegensis TaxID=2480810 RepID=A0A4Q8LSL2_9GAMM|nr:MULTISPECIES: ABC transporter substrate-binding protein [Pseudoxanthomonas]PZP63660.1 MAG: organic solvent ABC transporter [Pseudoxanthomonas spadix]MDQ1120823.1 phospholipid transport system substrate-binding protein [Pseudoxanthomonas winnipegensis]MDQ1134048.1 phospholipid transport system substrate-binding protein [Pseudoxanthomonas winnipegensis]MDR6139716.1 phospholipid transport system substrate-binding protein [Pseudoxanthomonas sp. SORGH_AS_0997]RZZ83781.1 ABC transporter substrate